MKISRRAFLKYTGGTTLTLFAFNKLGVPRAIAQIHGGSLDPTCASPMVGFKRASIGAPDRAVLAAIGVALVVERAEKGTNRAT